MYLVSNFFLSVFIFKHIRSQVLSVSKRNAHVMLTKHLLTRWLPKAKSQNKPPRDFLFFVTTFWQLKL